METTREMHQQKMEAQLKEWRARFDVVKAKAEQASAEVKLEVHRHLEELDDLERAAGRHLDQLKVTTAERWSEVRRDVERRWDALGGAFEALWQKVKA